LKTDSELFHVLTQLQDEVHRFAITFHREKRSKHALQSELDEIKGIGPKTKDELLAKLKSVKRIKDADLEELTTAIGASKGKIVYDYFHQTNE
jgi:excinuclease ABC subunit C